MGGEGYDSMVRQTFKSENEAYKFYLGKTPGKSSRQTKMTRGTQTLSLGPSVHYESVRARKPPRSNTFIQFNNE
ncbi:hypothetical protein CFC21_038084 [Triticum aestivum]|uniref:Uncharacterized protein n=3 Tax=Triticum TaxID=4564 RepID=A0A9R0S2G5_TRITD|nr:hypothetical protein CFC21_038084 [Triticum aestivum]VAH68900.1 unnamed protein product [Triticum turgidum subsp. durum]